MAKKNKIVDFEVLFDDFFIELNPETTLSPIEKKTVLSVINDFQDGHWRKSKFQEFVWDNIAETSLSYKERIALINRPSTSLIESAKKLRLTDKEKDEKGKGSELAEIVLYGIMKHYYSALPVVPKIFYKQNVQDNAKGADSVHIVVDMENKTFSLWLGEAKFYNSIDDNRLGSIVQSVENSLQSDKLEKENSIITSLTDLEMYFKDGSNNFKDVEQEALYNSIIDYIKRGESIDKVKPILHIPILLLHECTITKNCNELSEDYRNKIIAYHKDRAESYFKKQIDKFSRLIFKYDEIHFHLILFPVPEKEPIINAFIQNVEHFKEQA